jgi:hypothetical protein
MLVEVFLGIRGLLGYLRIDGGIRLSILLQNE